MWLVNAEQDHHWIEHNVVSLYIIVNKQEIHQ